MGLSDTKKSTKNHHVPLPVKDKKHVTRSNEKIKTPPQMQVLDHSKKHSKSPKKHVHEAQQKAHDYKLYKPLVVPTMPDLIEVAPEDGKMRFSDLGLHPTILAGIQDLGFKYCTPVQALSIPKLLEGRDVIGKAQTGTGKTAAFLTAIFQHFLINVKPQRKAGGCRAVVLAPTRELAIQIHKDAEEIGKYCGFRNLVVFGGMDHQKQLQSVKDQPIDLLIGTPGRLIDYMQQGALNITEAEILVIDEADRMLDMGFIPDVSRIVNRMPAPGLRQTFFYSATFTREVMSLANRWLKDPETIEIASDKAVTDLIEQRFYSVLRDEKFNLLCWIIKNEDVKRMMVFGNRRDFNSDLAMRLKKMGIVCELLSGDVPQEKRIKVLERFREGTVKVLVATDVAARGIHVSEVSHVVNYDLPDQGEDYIHRVGRTGRAGEKGQAISFVCEYGAYNIEAIESAIGNAIVCEQPTDEMVAPPKK